MDEQKILDTFGFNFKMYRTKLKMSQDDVADKTNFSKSYISNVENGKHSLSLVNALIFANVVDKTIEEMLREIDQTDVKFLPKNFRKSLRRQVRYEAFDKLPSPVEDTAAENFVFDCYRW